MKSLSKILMSSLATVLLLLSVSTAHAHLVGKCSGHMVTASNKGSHLLATARVIAKKNWQHKAHHVLKDHGIYRWPIWIKSHQKSIRCHKRSGHWRCTVKGKPCWL